MGLEIYLIFFFFLVWVSSFWCLFLQLSANTAVRRKCLALLKIEKFYCSRSDIATSSETFFNVYCYQFIVNCFLLGLIRRESDCIELYNNNFLWYVHIAVTFSVQSYIDRNFEVALVRRSFITLIIQEQILTVCYYHVTYEFQNESKLYTLHEFQGTPCLKQAPYLKFKW